MSKFRADIHSATAHLLKCTLGAVEYLLTKSKQNIQTLKTCQDPSATPRFPVAAAGVREGGDVFTRCSSDPEHLLNPDRRKHHVCGKGSLWFMKELWKSWTNIGSPAAEIKTQKKILGLIVGYIFR